MRITTFFVLSAATLCLNTSALAAENFAEKDYSNETLSLSYSGQPVIGKTVKYTPDATNSDKGKLTVSSVMDLSMIPNIPEQLKKQIPGPGLLPGSQETILDISLIRSSETAASAKFKGNASTDYLTYTYEGTISSDRLDLSITDAELKDLTLAGNWTLTPYKLDENDGTQISSPIHMVWTSDKQLSIGEGFELPVETILKLVVALPLFEDQNATQKLEESLKKVSFLADGNITADVFTAEGINMTSPLNLAQYVVNSDNSMSLYLNPQAIAAADAQPRPGIRRAQESEPTGIDINNILGNLLSQISPMLATGCPLSFNITGNNLLVYADEKLLLPLLKQNAVPLLNNDDFIKMICDMIAEDPDMGAMADMIPGIAKSLVDVINSTTKIEIGLSLEKENTDSVNDLISGNNSEKEIIARYNLQGIPVGADADGIIIVIYKDGSSSKILNTKK